MKVAHLFADYGVESEVLSRIGSVTRFTIGPEPTPYVDETVEMNLMEQTPSGTFDLAVLHPRCTDRSDMTSIDGDAGDHENQIPRARDIAEQVADDYVIENKPRDDLRDPTVLNGRMFGLPIAYERAFETSFPTRQPPRNQTLATETSTFFYSGKDHRWWCSVKGISGDYPKEHVAKNCLPLPYVHWVARQWLNATGEAEGVTDYSDYDKRKTAERNRAENHALETFADGGTSTN